MSAPALSANLIVRETAISIAINMVLSLAFFLLIFGRDDDVAVWGVGNLVFDNGVQLFMITLMSTFVPGTLLLKRLGLKRAGHALALRSLLRAAIVTVLAGTVLAACFRALEIITLPFSNALIFKLALGAAVAAIATPLGLQTILRRAQA